MSTESSKALVLKACQCIHERNMTKLLDLLHDQATWSVPYREDKFQFAGRRDKRAFQEMVGGFLSGFTSWSFTPTSVTAEGDRVSVEATSEGVGPGKAAYKNVYNFSFLIKDGKIHTVREFFDPFEVLAYVEQIPA